MRSKGDRKTRRLALSAMLFALCCALSVLESVVTAPLGLPPGVKPGLANVVVMFSLFFLGWRPALALVVLKAAFGALVRGPAAGFLSLCGGLLSLGVLCLLLAVFKKRISWTMLSVSGALMHNFGQLLGISLWMRTTAALYYLPVLVLAGIACGVLSSAVLTLLMPALKRSGLIADTTHINDKDSQ